MIGRAASWGPVRVWNRFWFTYVSGLAFALVRVGFAVTLLLTLLEFAPLLAQHYTADGFFPMDAARRWNWGNLIALLHLDVLDGLVPIVLIYTTLLCGCLALVVGWHTRASAAVVFLLLLWFQSRNPTYLNGGDEVLRLTAFYLFLGYLEIPREQRTLTWDRARALGGGRDAWLGGEMRAWPVRMIQLQMCILYCVAGAWKLAGESWWTGDALFYSLQNPQVARFVVPVGAWMEPLFKAGSVSVALWEFTFPLLFVVRRLRPWALVFGLLMHLGILLTMNIGFFSLAMLATYPALVGPAGVERWRSRWLSGRVGQAAHEGLDAGSGLVTVGKADPE